MSVLRNIESKIEGLVEGVFSRAFRSEVQPVEIARKLAKEMDSHQTASISKVYVPNEYSVWLAPADHERFSGYESALEQELGAYLLEHARRSGYDLLTRPRVGLDLDERLETGEFGIQARLVKPPSRGGDAPAQGEAGHTKIYTAVPTPPSDAGGEAEVPVTAAAAVLALPDRRYVLEGPTAVIGRSSQCDCVLRDQNASRRHAELRRTGGSWEIADLGSTNGIKVNGRRTDRAQLNPGDEVTIGTTSFTFDQQ